MEAKIGLSVLCVDDESDVRDFIVDVLNGIVCRVHTASNGIDGLKSYEEHRPDIVITDVRMPQMDGVQMIRAIRKFNDGVRLIIASAFCEAEDMLNAIDLDIDHYLSKPIHRAVLLKAVEKCAELKFLTKAQQKAEERLKQANEVLEKKAQERAAELERAFETIIRSQKQWQETFDNIGDMIAIINTDFDLMKVNKAFAASVGRHPRELIGKKCYPHFCNSNEVPDFCPHLRTMENGKPSTAEIRRIGDGRLFRVSCFPYRTKAGAVVGSIQIARDITDEKEREMRTILNERFAMLGQMASGIAHEINNPLASIAGCCDAMIGWARRKEWNVHKFENYLEMMREEVFRCKNITSSMLSLVRNRRSESDQVDVAVSVDRALELIGFQGRLRQITVDRHYCRDILPVKASAGQLRQVFMSLLSNALDAMEDVGKLTLETTADEEFVRVRIIDTGSGILPENMDRIFDAFYTTKADSGGTGLGLSIASKIVSELGGKMAIVSTGPEGTTFEVALPYSKI